MNPVLNKEALFDIFEFQAIKMNWCEGYEPYRADRSRCGEDFYRPEILAFLNTFVPQKSITIKTKHEKYFAGITAKRFTLEISEVASWRVLRGRNIAIDEEFPLCRIVVVRGGRPHKVSIFVTGPDFQPLVSFEDRYGRKNYGY